MSENIFAPLANAGRPVSEILGPQDDSAFGNVLRFLGRPGFAVRSLLAGDPEGALRNVAQMALDLPTGGFISRDLSLANLFNPESGVGFLSDIVEAPGGDLTTAEQRPEFSDVVSDDPENLPVGEKILLDLIGGVVTDPLTFLGGAGLGRGLASGAIQAAPRNVVLPNIARALEETKAGRMLLEDETFGMLKKMAGDYNETVSNLEAGFMTSDKLENLRSNQIFSHLSATLGTEQDQLMRAETLRAALQRRDPSLVTQTRLVPTTPIPGVPETSEGVLQGMINRGATAEDATSIFRAAQNRAAENIFLRHAFDGSGPLDPTNLRLTRQITNDFAEDGIKGLADADLILDRRQMYWRVPFTEFEGKINLPGFDNFWGNVGKYWTAPGWLRWGFGRAEWALTGEDKFAKLLDDSVLRLRDWAVSTFWDKTQAFGRLLPDSVANAMRQFTYEGMAERRSIQNTVFDFAERGVDATDGKFAYTARQNVEEWARSELDARLRIWDQNLGIIRAAVEDAGAPGAPMMQEAVLGPMMLPGGVPGSLRGALGIEFPEQITTDLSGAVLTHGPVHRAPLFDRMRHMVDGELFHGRSNHMMIAQPDEFDQVDAMMRSLSDRVNPSDFKFIEVPFPGETEGRRLYFHKSVNQVQLDRTTRALSNLLTESPTRFRGMTFWKDARTHADDLVWLGQRFGTNYDEISRALQRQMLDVMTDVDLTPVQGVANNRLGYLEMIRQYDESDNMQFLAQAVRIAQRNGIDPSEADELAEFLGEAAGNVTPVPDDFMASLAVWNQIAPPQSLDFAAGNALVDLQGLATVDLMLREILPPAEAAAVRVPPTLTNPEGIPSAWRNIPEARRRSLMERFLEKQEARFRKIQQMKLPAFTQTEMLNRVISHHERLAGGQGWNEEVFGRVPDRASVGPGAQRILDNYRLDDPDVVPDAMSNQPVFAHNVAQRLVDDVQPVVAMSGGRDRMVKALSSVFSGRADTDIDLSVADEITINDFEGNLAMRIRGQSVSRGMRDRSWPDQVLDVQEMGPAPAPHFGEVGSPDFEPGLNQAWGEILSVARGARPLGHSGSLPGDMIDEIRTVVDDIMDDGSLPFNMQQDVDMWLQLEVEPAMAEVAQAMHSGRLRFARTADDNFIWANQNTPESEVRRLVDAWNNRESGGPISREEAIEGVRNHLVVGQMLGFRTRAQQLEGMAGPGSMTYAETLLSRHLPAEEVSGVATRLVDEVAQPDKDLMVWWVDEVNPRSEPVHGPQVGASFSADPNTRAQGGIESEVRPWTLMTPAERGSRQARAHMVAADLDRMLDARDFDRPAGIPLAPATAAPDYDIAQARALMNMGVPRETAGQIIHRNGVASALNAQQYPVRGSGVRHMLSHADGRNVIERTAGARPGVFHGGMLGGRGIEAQLFRPGRQEVEALMDSVVKPLDPQRRRLIREFHTKVHQDFGRIPSELARLGVFAQSATANPFYVPHQLSPIVETLLEERIGNPALSGALDRVFEGMPISDVFTRARANDLQGFIDRGNDLLGLAINQNDNALDQIGDILVKLAEDHGLDAIDLHPRNLVNQDDLLVLYRDRMFAHARTKERAKAAREILRHQNMAVQTEARSIAQRNYNALPAEEKTAERFQQLVQEATQSNELRDRGIQATFERYLRLQFESLGMRESFLGKMLGGGRLQVPVEGIRSSELEAWAREAASGDVPAGNHWFKREIRTVREPSGALRREIHIKWPGLNYFWKPALTSLAVNVGKNTIPLNPAYHVRNIVSTFFMAITDPEMSKGKRGFLHNIKAVWGALNDSIFVRTLAKNGWQDGDVADFMTVIGGDATQALAAEARLLQNPALRIGKYDAKTVIDTLKAGLGKRIAFREGDEITGISRMDLALRATKFDIYGREIAEGGPRIKQAFNRFVQLGFDYAEAAETRVRAQHILNLLERGLTPQNALERTARAFVDYSHQSVTERFVRDLIPFAKWTMGAARWTKDVANRPVLVNWMGRLRPDGDGDYLPERAEDSLALPLPWRDREGNKQFLLGLGLPLESTLNILSAPTPRGFRRQILGGLSPAIKLPAEAIANRNFFFGDEFGRFRKAPEWLTRFAPGMTQEVPIGDGRVRHEISGTANEIMNALPATRLDSMVDKWLDDRRSSVNKLLNTTTGIRTLSVDTEREFKLRIMDYLKDKARSGQVGETLVYFDRLDPEQVPEDLKIVLQELRKIEAKKRKERAKREKQRGLFGQGFGF